MTRYSQTDTWCARPILNGLYRSPAESAGAGRTLVVSEPQSACVGRKGLPMSRPDPRQEFARSTNFFRDGRIVNVPAPVLGPAVSIPVWFFPEA